MMADDHLLEFGTSWHDSGIFSTTSMMLASMGIASKLHNERAWDLLCIMIEPKCIKRSLWKFLGNEMDVSMDASVFPVFLHI